MIPNILYVYHSGIAVPYLTCMLDYLANTCIKLQKITLKQFAAMRNISPDVIVIYQTYADENHHKFNKIKKVVKVTDDMVMNHGKSILFDAHDSGTADGFSRLPRFPRIKNTPNYLKMQEYNVIVSTTFPLKVNMNYMDWKIIKSSKTEEKKIDISYKVGLMQHSTHPSGYIRRAIYELLTKYQFGKHLHKDLGMDKKVAYQTHLARTKISVNAPGYGEACIRHLLTLLCGSCMLAHESINNIKLLPGVDLIDGEDYLSFNVNNLSERLDYLLSRTHRIKKITANGIRKFKDGYSIIRPASQLMDKIKSLYA